MSMSHALKYHLAIPAAIIAGLLVIGVPIGTALFIGMMAGCMSMMLMMVTPRSQDRNHDDRTPR